MATLGTISLQANDKTDVFFVTQVRETGKEGSDESLMQIEDTQFDSDCLWVTGNVPAFTPVYIEGDTAMIQGWFRGENYQDPFVITVYVECELAEELVGVRDAEDDERRAKDNNKPTDVFL